MRSGTCKTPDRRPVRVANCSGFYGDRLAAAEEMVDGGPIDFLTGDWLAELTMLILAKNRLRDPGAGYARTFVTQMEQTMTSCLEKGIRVVSNAGGLNPRGCADAIASVAERLGVTPVIAVVDGDDLVPRLQELRDYGVNFTHLETGAGLGERDVMTANAYLGGWGIAAALDAGAQIVVTGRVTDAALTLGPAAHWHGWAVDDWDALAGALVAGHLIECGAQVTGGNYSFFSEIPDLSHPGFPVAEVAWDGSAVITKHPGHGGAVTIGTVTAQLLYEIGGPRYLSPDVTARFDTVRLSHVGPDRVGVSGVRGEPPPTTTKVSLNYVGGWRSTVTLALTGLDIEAKAQLVEKALWSTVPGGKGSFTNVTVDLLRTDSEDPESNEAAIAQLRITVKDPDQAKVGRSFVSKATELGLACYPGLFFLPSSTESYGVYWPALVPAALVTARVSVDGQEVVTDRLISSNSRPLSEPASADPFEPIAESLRMGSMAVGIGAFVRAPLGKVIGARSGDKGGNANLGVWVRTQAAWDWLIDWLDTVRLQALLPETAPLTVRRYPLPNVQAINFVIEGLLGEGVASSTRIDPQAKSLGEWLRARTADIPSQVLGDNA